MKAWTTLTQASKSQQQRRKAGCFLDTRGMKAQFEWNEEKWSMKERKLVQTGFLRNTNQKKTG